MASDVALCRLFCRRVSRQYPVSYSVGGWMWRVDPRPVLPQRINELVSRIRNHRFALLEQSRIPPQCQRYR